MSGFSLRQWQQQQHREGCDFTEAGALGDEDRLTIEEAESQSIISMTEASFPTQIPTTLTWSPADSTGFSPLTPQTSCNFDLSGIDDRSDIQHEEDDVEEVVRRDSITSTRATASKGLTRHFPSLQQGTPRLEFCSPSFVEFTERKNRRHLIDHFCNVLSHLIVFREENGNPFQQLVLPLSHSSPAVMDSIYALASAHLEYRGVKNAEKSDYFHGKAIQQLARLIENGGGEDRNELLAAIMLLVYYEVVSLCYCR